jgi:hypothetical protein
MGTRRFRSSVIVPAQPLGFSRLHLVGLAADRPLGYAIDPRRGRIAIATAQVGHGFGKPGRPVGHADQIL